MTCLQARRLMQSQLYRQVGGPGRLEGGGDGKIGDDVRMGHDLSLGPGGHKRDAGTPNPSGPQATDSDGSGGRPLKKRSNR